MWIGRSSAHCAFHPAELNSGYHALSVDIFREIRNPRQSALHLTHRPGKAEFGDTTNIMPSRRASGTDFARSNRTMDIRAQSLARPRSPIGISNTFPHAAS
jgi:hypothetical protein